LSSTWQEDLPDERRSSSAAGEPGVEINGKLEVGITEPEPKKPLDWCDRGQIKAKVISYRNLIKTEYFEIWGVLDKKTAIEFRRPVTSDRWETTLICRFTDEKYVKLWEHRDLEDIEFHTHPNMWRQGVVKKRVVDTRISARVVYRIAPSSLLSTRPGAEIPFVGQVNGLMAVIEEPLFFELEKPIIQKIIAKI